MKNLIYIPKSRLIGIDNMLPVLMEIKQRYPDINISIILFDKGHLEAVKENYNIFETINMLKPDLYVLRTGNKFITLIKLIIFILKFSFKANIIIKNEDVLPFHGIVMASLKALSKTKEIKAYLITKSLEGHKNAYIKNTFIYARKDNKEELLYRLLGGSYDYYLSVLSADNFKGLIGIEAPAHKMVKVGYIRRLPQWQKFMAEAIKRNKAINNGPYFLYVLAYTERRWITSAGPEMIELIEESLSVLKKYNDRLRTIFKPHVITDIKKVREVIENVGYSNYLIDYGHPMVLSSKAQFIFGNIFSDTMYDAYYLGRPVIEYCMYDDELSANIGRRSYGGRCCDFFIWRDKKKLEEVLDKVINARVNVIRDAGFIQENFPETPHEFYEFWERLLR